VSSARVCTSSCLCRCALAILQRPMVRAHLNVAISSPKGDPHFQAPPTAMFVGAALFMPSWPPPTPPSIRHGLGGRIRTPCRRPLVRTEWITDSGASYHTSPDASILSSVRPPPPSSLSSITVSDGSCLHVTPVGSAPGPYRLPDVLIAP
jgi:hypothetical protein